MEQRSNRKGIIRSRCAYLRLVRVTANDTIATGCDPTACCLAIESLNEAMKIDSNYRGTFVTKTWSFSKSDKMHEICLRLFTHRYNLSFCPT